MHLPKPIQIYFRSDSALDPDALATCVAPNATVRDEGRPFVGLAAVTAWRIEAKRTYAYTVEPLEAVQRDGKTVVTSRVSAWSSGARR
jgi:hypothetical protein